MIYYFPSEIDLQNLNKASKIRPYEMSKNLKDSDIFIQGRSLSRVRKLLKCLLFYKGDKIIYIESNNFPFYLSEIRRFEIWFLLEIIFLAIFKLKGFKIGVFYRDLFWRHSDFKPKDLKSQIKHIFYLIEWKFYTFITKVIFLPTKKIIELLPKNNKKVKILWPGLNVNIDKLEFNSLTNLSFLYIGGVLPPFYDLTPLFKIAKKSKKHNFIICTRESEWDYVSKENIYESLSNVKVVFKSYEDVPELYKTTNTILIDPRRPSGYYSYSLPFKYLESSSYGCPVINLKGTASDDFFKKNDYSWSFNNENEIFDFINNLTIELVNQKRSKIKESINDHTWENRINFLRETLKNA